MVLGRNRRNEMNKEYVNFGEEWDFWKVTLVYNYENNWFLQVLDKMSKTCAGFILWLAGIMKPNDKL